MNYSLQVFLWNVGSDHVDEIAMKVADLLRDNCLALPADAPPDERINSMLVLKHAGDEIAISDGADAMRFMAKVSKGARMVVVPHDGAPHVGMPGMND